MRKPVFQVFDQVRHELGVRLQKMARGLKFRIKEVEGLYYVAKTKALISDYRAADLSLCFRICKKQVFFMTWLKCILVNHSSKTKVFRNFLKVKCYTVLLSSYYYEIRS